MLCILAGGRGDSVTLSLHGNVSPVSFRFSFSIYKTFRQFLLSNVNLNRCETI